MIPAAPTGSGRIVDIDEAMLQPEVRGQVCPQGLDAVTLGGMMAGGQIVDAELSRLMGMARALRIADGPDEVHRGMVARLELKKYV